MIRYKEGKLNKKISAVVMAAVMVIALLISSFIFLEKIVYADSTQGIVTTNDVNFRSSPGGEIIGQVNYGDKVTILGEAEDGTWYHVMADDQEGYVYADYVAVVTEETDEAFEEMIAEFPESYKEKLRVLHAIYPNYIFQADYVDIDFDTLVSAQSKRKTINAEAGDSWKAMYDNYNWSTGEFTYREGGYTTASRELIAYYIDPRNWLTSDEVYTFLRQSATGNETKKELKKLVSGTFLAGTYSPKSGDADDVACKGSYINVIMKAAEISGVSPYVIASTIIQEQGVNKSVMCSGTYSGSNGYYYGYFNFYNINATGNSTTDVIENGLSYAMEEGWDNVYDAIVQGAVWYANGYINQNQDTCYYKDFNVLNGTSSYWHQYSTAVYDHQNIGCILGSSLSENKNTAWTFRIPVYNDMPEEPAEKPEENDNLNNYYFTNLEITGMDLGFDMYDRSYKITIDKNITIRYTLPDGAKYIGKSYYDITAGTKTIPLRVKSQTGYTRTYYIKVSAAEDCRVYVNDSADGDVKEKTDSAYKLGDPNGDGETNVIDLAVIKKHILGKVVLKGDKFTAADINGDKKINVIDLALIKKYILGKIKSFE